ncbi:neuropeptide receptor 22-like [Haliotis asinina]|uniref:neuropeptide receptor 22-like n=1 Tax=Haliotis asinina TaxID=109174 RepID=UPI0035318279
MNSSVQLNVTKSGSMPSLAEIIAFAISVRKVYAIMEILITPIIVSANIVLIVSILSNGTLRRQFRYLTMTSIATADLLIGIFSCPFRADMILNSYRHGCIFYLFMTVIELYVQMFVGTWNIVIINADYLLTFFHIKRPQLKTFTRKFVFAVILGLPWLAMFFVVLPVAYVHAKEYLTLFRSCRLVISFEGKKMVMALSFFVPAFITVVQVTIMTTMHLYRQRTGSGMPSLMTSPEAVQSPWVYVAGSLVMIIMVGFEQCTVMAQRALMKVVLQKYKAILFIRYSSRFLSDFKSGVTPIVWFAIPELRAAFMDLVNKLPWRQRRSGGGNEQTVSYRNLSEDISIP